MNRLRFGLLSVAGLVWFGCSSAGTSPDGGGSTGGAVSSSGGAIGSSGGAVGVGGVAPGVGGVAPGVGGAGPGVGGTAPGVGGTAPGVGGTAPGSGGASTLACTGAATASGYMDNGTLCGYAWTATNMEGETIDPPCGTAGPCFDTMICADATIPANADPVYTGVMIGWNVAQANGATATQTWNATGAGITVNFVAPAATGETRVIIQSGGTDYCAPMAASGVALTWSDFTVSCWEAGGTAFTAGSPITAIAVQINGAATAQTVSGFCLNGVTVN